ncbi:MAG: ATP-grasp domain-containing protein [Lachnospiraceae bacterium]|nr:ATP-grasp domain-containing protein [Lachnospiraceae bacterium]
MSRKKNLLIFPAGTEIAFEILNALKFSKFINIYGGTSIDEHSEFVYSKLIKGFPFIGEDGFIEYLNKVISEYNIEYIYPAHDSVSMYLAEYADKINADVISAKYETVKICRSKAETYDFFRNKRFVPKIYESADAVEQYPVFVKPAVGQGSIGAKKIKNATQLENALEQDSSLVISEYLPGMEYTVDCFTDKNRQLRVTKLRDRQRIRAGISVRSKELPVDSDILEIANALNQGLEFRGAWFFQVKRNIEGEYRLMEVSPRVPGTMGLSRNMGINFPLLTLFDRWGYDIDIIDNEYEIMLDRAFYSAYKIEYEYEHVYVDYDDTLVIDGCVNTQLLTFLYQAHQKRKKIHLLTKHKGDIYADLKKMCISDLLFDEIKMIEMNDEKGNYICKNAAIFIDDSYAERRKIKDVLGIPVFDVDMVESLIDWKM